MVVRQYCRYIYIYKQKRSANFYIAIKNLGVSTCQMHRIRQVRMRREADILWLIHKIPSGDALGASDSCMHMFTHAHHAMRK